MSLNIPQLIAVVVIIGFAVYGFATGLIRVIGSIVGIFVGVWIATHYYTTAADFLLPYLGHNVLLAGIVGFALLFIATNVILGVLFYIVDRIYRLVAIIPGLKLINRIAGMVVGILEGVLIVGILFNAYTKLPIPVHADVTENAPFLKGVMSASSFVIPGYEKALEQAKSFLK